MVKIISVVTLAMLIGWTGLARAQATASDLALALDFTNVACGLPGSSCTSATLTASPGAASVSGSLGGLQPVQGPDFAILGTGVIGSQAEPGTDFAPPGPLGDTTILSLEITPPAAVNKLSFYYTFLSAEYPEYIGPNARDRFTVSLTDGSGTTVIVDTSTNDPDFKTVGGGDFDSSGYDLFTENPTGVDTNFGNGFYGGPDAGATGRIRVEADVQGGATFTLEFKIEDGQDGDLDSTAILDSLVLTAFEIIDPNPTFILGGGELNTNRESIDTGGKPIHGAAADGVTLVLLREEVPGPGTVEFCIESSANIGNGEIRLLTGDLWLGCQTDTVVNTSDGWFAFALYRPPLDFNRSSGDDNQKEREFNLVATYEPGGVPPGLTTDLPFKLVRAPLLFMHGVWSSEDTWTMPLATDSRWEILIGDYKKTNASSLDTNRNVVGNHITEILYEVRNDDLAVTQADVISHSMGGILSRWHYKTANYRHDNNFQQGDLHKIMTMNTPHLGSPLPDLANQIRAITTFDIGTKFELGMSAIGFPVDLGAMDDLAVCSAALETLGTTMVPSHAFIGTGGQAIVANAPDPLGAIFSVIEFFASDEISDWFDLYEDQLHDLIVWRSSQIGEISLVGGATHELSGADSIHLEVTGSSNYSNLAENQLNLQASHTTFDNFPAPSTTADCTMPGQPASATSTGTPKPAFTAAAIQSNGISITQPPNLTVVTAGSILLVEVTPDAGANIDEVIVVGPGVAEIDTVSPFQLLLIIPLDEAGPFQLSAWGKASDGSFSPQASLDLNVISPFALNGIELVPPKLNLFEFGQQRQMAAFGQYDDDIPRDISDPSTGTQFFSSDPAVADVTPDGLVTAVGHGVATVWAVNELTGDSIRVVVDLSNLPPLANSGSNLVGTAGSTIQLDGAQSLDPDLAPGPLSFDWYQVSGPAVAVQDGGTATPSFTPTQAGTYVFGLYVFDGMLVSQLETVQVDVSPAPICGDGNVDLGEECDDGGTTSGDGCSATCLLEPAFELYGTAAGGTIDLVLSGVVLQVVTSPGANATTVLSELATAINTDPTLGALGVTAIVDGNVLRSNGSVDSIVLSDAGLSLIAAAVPMLSPLATSVLAALLFGLSVRHSRRV